MIRGIHHVQLTVPAGAEEEARLFYCGVLGLREIDKPAGLTGRGGLWLQAGDRQVQIGVEGGVDRLATKAHVAYQVSDLAGWRARLTSLGKETSEGVPIPGHDRFEFRDPFGNRVEFIEPRQATAQPDPIIGPYEERQAVCQEYDPRAVPAAQRVAALIQSRLPGVLVEHIGSTAVPGCAGKGVVDLMLVYPDGLLEASRQVLESLGFQRQTTRDPFPEDRPMRTGSVVHDGTTFLLHVHIIASSSPEAQVLRRFRDRLRIDPGLVSAYVAAKKAILTSGVTDTVDYADGKGDFVQQALRQISPPDHSRQQVPAPAKVNLREKLALFSNHWSPKIVGELNGQQVKLVKLLGEFVWHKHDHEDELFLVVKGRFRMEFRDRHVWLEEGEFLVVPRGVEHRPVAEEEAHVLLFEPASTLNTGNVQNERTVAQLDRI